VRVCGDAQCDDEHPEQKRADDVDRDRHPRKRVAVESGGDPVAQENTGRSRERHKKHRHAADDLRA
jgi:hypothetical protein